MPGCFPNLDVTSGYIAVRNFHQFFPNAISETENGNESSVPEMPPELDVSELMPITYKDYIMQTIQDSLVKIFGFVSSKHFTFLSIPFIHIHSLIHSIE